jgi:signal transduction histidine kinase
MIQVGAAFAVSTRDGQMTTAVATPLAVYELPPAVGQPIAAETPVGRSSLAQALLLKNAQWFCGLRWIVVAMLAAFGILGLFPHVLGPMGLRPSPGWPLATAAILALGNVGFFTLTRALARPSACRYAHLDLWSQILFDLLILTGVVYFVGAMATFIAFAYLFHIVLACIFLSRAESLAVTLIACALSTASIAAQATGLLPSPCVLADVPVQGHLHAGLWVPIWNQALALSIWITVWYLTSSLSAMVRARDEELAAANGRLQAAVEERARHMLRTTHELKAPFAAIHACTQVLLSGQCGPLPQEAREFIERISTRCRRLAEEIREMVQLANLRSESQGVAPSAGVQVSEILGWCLAQVLPVAEQRHVVFETDLRPARTVGVEEHLKMLFTNVLANAVVYSVPGGRVRVRCGPTGTGGPAVTIEDEGIGIPAEKLPHIFEEYYRTDEAVRHNKQSSGLGLAIVRHVAQAHGIRIRVESRLGVGTCFNMDLPSEEGAPRRDAQNKEKEDGLRDGL